MNDAYLELIKRCLTRYSFPDKYRPLHRPSIYHPWARFLYPIVYPPAAWLLNKLGFVIVRDPKFVSSTRWEGHDLPPEAETMMGMDRLNNVHHCIEQIVKDGVEGDFIETGVWRGGGCIFMKAALNACGDTKRIVWVADSFEGCPKPDGRFDEREDAKFWVMGEVLGITLERVKANFNRYGLLDDRVRFLKGWFKDTLPQAPISRLALMRLDGDMYSSTTDALVNLYPKLSPGGFVIIDDYNANFSACRNAVNDFRAKNGVTEPIFKVDWTGVYWRKGK